MLISYIKKSAAIPTGYNHDSQDVAIFAANRTHQPKGFGQALSKPPGEELYLSVHVAGGVKEC